jgi:hypothetical protein
VAAQPVRDDGRGVRFAKQKSKEKSGREWMTFS